MHVTRNLQFAMVAPFIGVALGQTPPAFNPEVDTSLDISYSGAEVQSGQLLAMSKVAAAPNITVPSNVTMAANSTGLLIMMDLDMSAPNGSMASNSSSSGSFTTFLNWLATDINLASNPISIPADQGAPYFPPSPPSSDDSPHRYVFLLFAQPNGFSFPQAYNRISPPLTTNSRLGFDLASFAIAANLNVPVAADWITVKSASAHGKNGTATGSTPKPTGAAAGNATMGAPSGTGSAPVPKKSSAAVDLAASMTGLNLGFVAVLIAMFA